MKPFGTWGAVASFQLSGIIGCSVAIAGILLGGWVPLVGVFVAMAIFAIGGWAIASVDWGTGALSNSLSGQVVRSSTNFVSTTTGKVVTGVAIAGLVTTATVANVSPSGQVTPMSTRAETSTVLSSQIESTAPEINDTTIVETLAPTQPAECAQLSLTPEECANAGKHLYSSGETIKFIDGVETNGVIHVCTEPNEAFLQEHEWWFFSSARNAIDPTYKKSGDNSYSQYENSGPSSFGTIEFTAAGFIFRYYIEEQLCTETAFTRIEN
jgi:hypothetical protein